jgi:hypothetical protein
MALVLGIAFFAALAALLWTAAQQPPKAPEAEPEPDPRAVLGMHEARTRLDAAWLRHQAETDALRLRRELDLELDRLGEG